MIDNKEQLAYEKYQALKFKKYTVSQNQSYMSAK